MIRHLPGCSTHLVLSKDISGILLNMLGDCTNPLYRPLPIYEKKSNEIIKGYRTKDVVAFLEQFGEQNEIQSLLVTTFNKVDFVEVDYLLPSSDKDLDRAEIHKQLESAICRSVIDGNALIDNSELNGYFFRSLLVYVQPTYADAIEVNWHEYDKNDLFKCATSRMNQYFNREMSDLMDIFRKYGGGSIKYEGYLDNMTTRSRYIQLNNVVVIYNRLQDFISIGYLLAVLESGLFFEVENNFSDNMWVIIDINNTQYNINLEDNRTWGEYNLQDYTDYPTSDKGWTVSIYRATDMDGLKETIGKDPLVILIIPNLIIEQFFVSD